MSFVVCHSQADGGHKLHFMEKVTKIHWVIQIRFGYSPLNQKSDKNEHSFFPQFMQITHNFYAFMLLVLEGTICRCYMK